MITIQSGKMIIPEEERFVGFAGDDRISTKQFILPQTQITDIDTVFSLYLRFDDDRVTSAPLNISIVDSDTILTWHVRAENLLKSGIVMAQIKYTNGEGCVAHYGCDYFVVGDISERGDDGEEYDILSRTEFEERMAQAVRDARATAPYIGDDGYWYIYSREQGDYVRSFSASGIPVDSEISGTSTNPIENRAVKQYVDACDSTKVDKTTCVAGVALNSGITADDLYEGLADTINPPTVTIGTTHGYPAQYGKTFEGTPVFCTGQSVWKALAKAEDIPTKTSELINDNGFLNDADIKNYLHYVAVTQETASSVYHHSLKNLTPNSYSYVLPEWWSKEEGGTITTDAPLNRTKAAWIFYIIPSSSSSYGMQIWLEPSTDIIYKRIKVRQQTNDGYEIVWSEWSFVTDPSLSVSGAFADAKAVGDALTQKVGVADILPYLHYVDITESSVSEYGRLLANIPKNSYSAVSASWFSDTPPDRVSGWIYYFARATSTSTIGVQIWFEPSTGVCFTRRNSSNGWGEWTRLDDAYDSDRTYFAFGDSLVAAQIGRWSGPTKYSKRGYADTTAAMLHMTLNNQAVGGQGLIKDWALIIDTINDLDMSDAGLITVGWYGNDGAIYRKAGLAMGSYTDVTTVDVTDAAAVKALVTYGSDGLPAENGFGTTVMGYYFTIMKLLQTKCPYAQIVLVTGYGHGGGSQADHLPPTFENQFTAVRTFGSGPSHTYQEMFDELEKMANLHSWGCVNQAKGCAFNEFNAAYLFGDHAHPTDDGYAKYGNNLAPRIAQFYANRKLVTYD